MRELNAVDSEHKKNHQSDMWRIFQLNKHLSVDGHPWRKFGSGNKDSLSKVGRELKAKGSLSGNAVMKSADGSLAPTPHDSRAPSPALSVSSVNSELEGDGGVVGRETRRRLVEWWSEEYCAGRMRLCVVGKGAYFCALTKSTVPDYDPQSLSTSFLRWSRPCSLLYPIVVRSRCI